MSDALIVCFMVNIIAEKIFRVGSCILIPVQGVGEKWEKFRNFFFLNFGNNIYIISSILLRSSELDALTFIC